MSDHINSNTTLEELMNQIDMDSNATPRERFMLELRDNFRHELDYKQSEVDDAQKEIDDLNEQIRALQDEIDEVNRENGELRTDISDLEGRIQEMEAAQGASQE